MNEAEARPTRNIKLAFVQNLVGNALPVVANIVTIPVLARVLGVDGRGETAAGTAAILLAVVVCGFGIPESLTYFIARSNGIIDHAQTISAFVLAVATGLIGVSMLYQLAPILSGGSEQVRHLILLTSWALVPTLCTGVLRGIASGLQRWHLVGAERSISAIVRATFLVSLAAFGALDVEWAAIVIAYSQAIGGLSYLGLLRPKLYARTAPIPGLFHFGIRVWLGTVAGIILMRIDQVLMTPLSSAAQLGLYAVAVSAAEIPLIVNTALREIVYAADAEYQDNARIALASRLSTCGVASTAIVIAIATPFLFPMVLGKDFAGSVIPCWILLAAVVIGNPASVVAASLSARGHPGMRSTALAVAASANCAIVFLLVPSLGAVGASFATLAGNVVSSMLVVIFFRQKYSTPISEFYKFRGEDIKAILRGLRRNKVQPQHGPERAK